MVLSVIFHYNPALSHQCRHAQAFRRAGVPVTPNPRAQGDVHIVSGPHYALNEWRKHPRTIWLDRAWWGDPEFVSIGWLNSDGSRTFAKGTEPREHPTCLPWKTREQSALILADYQQDITGLYTEAVQQYGHVTVRRHPADEKSSVSLDSALMLHDVCIGHSSTGLFDAIISGVPVICTDPTNVAWQFTNLHRGSRAKWLHDLSYSQFNHQEFGLALELLGAC